MGTVFGGGGQEGEEEEEKTEQMRYDMTKAYVNTKVRSHLQN